MDVGIVFLGFIAAMPALAGLINRSAGGTFVGAIFSVAAFVALVAGNVLACAALWLVGLALATAIASRGQRLAEERSDRKAMLAALKGRKLTADDCERA